MKKLVFSIIFAFSLSMFSLPSGKTLSENISFSSFVASADADVNIICPPVGQNSGRCHVPYYDVDPCTGTPVRSCKWTGYTNDSCSGLYNLILELLMP